LDAQRFHAIKSEIRVLGVDDGKFIPHTKSTAIVVGVVFRGARSIDAVMHTHVAVDGFDATAQIASMINGSPHCKQLRLVMLNGITYAGFNLVNIKKLSEDTRLPIIALTESKPNLEAIHKALNNLPGAEERWKVLLEAGKIHEINCKGKRLSIVLSGISLLDAEKIVELTSNRSCIPEPLRVAHLIASGISFWTVLIRKSLKGTMLRESPKRIGVSEYGILP
jgi:endonuclease V-like protein UPF0215 family